MFKELGLRHGSEQLQAVGTHLVNTSYLWAYRGLPRGHDSWVLNGRRS